MATDSSSYYRSRINHYLDQAEHTRATMPHNRALAVMCLKLAKVALDLYLRRMDEEDAERAQTALDEAEKTRRLQAVSQLALIRFWLA
jgi:hypothetical protein